ncbi:MAG: aminotransferase class IV [Gammaproteobacteria bacterium]|nr:aminotransferase class IV [Gammaproteobacteria bacterium]
MSLCYLNGEYLPLAEARVPVLDRGFIFGDGVYEVIPVFKRQPFRLGEHRARLARSLEAIGIRDPLDDAGWRALVERLVAGNAGEDQSLYVQVTRGVAPRNHAPPPDLVPTVFAMSTPLEMPADPAPVAAITLEDIRWSRCDIKAISLLANVMFREAATAAGAYEAILVRDGIVTEGAASNVFVVHGGRIRTAAHSPHILPGITRDLIVELLAGTPDAVREDPIPAALLVEAEEIWITSSTKELLAVTTLDGKPVADGKPGPVYRRIKAQFTAYREKMAGLP